MKNFSNYYLALFLVSLISINVVKSAGLLSKSSSSTTCHPQCSWKCDDPHCPAICDPVCEPPKCHTSCAEPKNAICDVKCEKPDCEIKCPDKGCEMFDCPKCVTVCKQPHCVTHCQAPKPECEAVCEEPKCDWKCHKPACPKPKCELVCENPNCSPKVECCACNNSQKNNVDVPFPFFKETEANPECCGCNNLFNKNLDTIPGSKTRTSVLDFGTHVVHSVSDNATVPFENPKPIGDSYYDYPTKKVEEFTQGKLSYTINPELKDADVQKK
jgi:hypothetical protein